MHTLSYAIRAEIPQTYIDQHVAPEFGNLWQVLEICVSASPCESATIEHVIARGLTLDDAYRTLVEALHVCVTSELIAVSR